MKWLISGSGGYIGSHLLRELADDKESFLPLAGKSISSERRLNFLNVKGLKVDITNRKSTLDIFREYKPDVVVHLASLKSPEESNRFPDLYINNNLETLSSVFNASLESGAKVFINTSSSAVYGNLDSDKIHEKDIGKPISFYGHSKKNGELFLDNFKNSDISISSLRLFNVVGSRDPNIGETANFHLVPSTIQRIASGKGPLIYGHHLPTKDGTPIRDYIHVVDVVKAIITLARFMITNTVNFSATNHLKMNIGSGFGTSVLEIATLIQNQMNTNYEPMYVSSRSGDPVKSVADISLASKSIGFKSNYEIEEIISSCFSGL